MLTEYTFLKIVILQGREVLMDADWALLLVTVLHKYHNVCFKYEIRFLKGQTRICHLDKL